MSLPPIAPPATIAAATTPQLHRRKQQQPAAAAAPRKAAAPLTPAKPPWKGAAAERSGAFSSSWPSASLQQQLPRSRAARGSRNPLPPQVAAAASPRAPVPPQAFARGRSVLAPPGSGTRSCESLCAAPAGRGEAAVRFSLCLPPEAIRVLQRRQLEKEKQQRQGGRAPRSASPDVATRPLAAASSAGGDLRALLQVSLLNERHRYDDAEYEEDDDDKAAGGPGASAADEGLVRKCTEWLRGVESAARDRADKLDTLPHLSTL